MPRKIPFRRFTEGDCRKAVLGALRGANVYCEPVEDKVRKGIPDVYVDGGIWIECKHLICTARGCGRNVITHCFTSAQKMRLARGGRDLNLAAFLMTTPKGDNAFFMCRFLRLYSTPGGPPEDRCLWYFKKAKAWGVPLDDAGPYIRACLVDRWQGAMKHLNLDPEWPASHLMSYHDDPGCVLEERASMKEGRGYE